MTNFMSYIFYHSKRYFPQTKIYENCWKHTNGQVIKIKRTIQGMFCIAMYGLALWKSAEKNRLLS